jgi:hypothetical protein
MAMKSAGSLCLAIRSYVSSIVAVSGFPAACAARSVPIVVVIAFEFLAGGFAPSTSRKSKSRANAVRTAIARQFRGWRESWGLYAQHLGAAPKDEARDRDATGPRWLWLDSEIDRRYERPMFEDTRVSTQRTVARAKNYAQKTTVGSAPLCFTFEEAIA